MVPNYSRKRIRKWLDKNLCQFRSRKHLFYKIYYYHFKLPSLPSRSEFEYFEIVFYIFINF